MKNQTVCLGKRLPDTQSHANEAAGHTVLFMQTAAIWGLSVQVECGVCGFHPHL